MVMKRSMMTKNLLQSIRRSLGRYIAIAVIIALGSAMFVGLRSTKMDMVATGQVYTDNQNMFDIRLISAFGWGKNQVYDVRKLPGIVDAEGVFYTDYIVNRGEEAEGSVYRFYTIPETVNKLVLLSGRMPEKPNECLADGFRTGKGALGTTIVMAEDNSETALEILNEREFTIVGIVSTPLYMDMNRGNTSIGSGSISNYFFVPETAFDVDYYTEIHVTIPGEYRIYSDEYNDAMSEAADLLKPFLEPLAKERLDRVRTDAIDAYRDGKAEYDDGLREYQEERKKAEDKLSDAFRELLEAEDTLRSNEKLLNDGKQQIQEGWDSVREGKKTLAASRQTLVSSKANAFREVSESAAKLLKKLKKVTSQKQSVDSELMRVNLDLLEVNAYILQFEYGISHPSEQEKADAYAKRAELEAKQTELQTKSDALSKELSAVESGLLEITVTQVAMEQQFSIAESQIDAGVAQLEVYEEELAYQEKTIAEGERALEDGKAEFQKGRREYYDGVREAKVKFDDAERELREAEEKLADARKTISEMTKNDTYVLDRNTNMGYNSLDSSSDIVAGVSKVFPVFFLLVAALVCITTMTRMVDEERTQIGTLKALGYSSAAIISKYLFYAGSSAIFGCIIGVTAGSIIFPTVLWEAYKIMIYITPTIVMKFDWQLALMVVVMYTTAMLAVTWYCCHKALQEVPAELIRPKAPANGKALIFEKLAVWNRLSFLNKVAVRNIFRYRQRLAMMMLGIGGCTALLMTGFGIRDSISKIVDVQFEEVTVYDMEVYFRENCDDEMQQSFRKTMAPYSRDILFFNQISGEISTDTQTRDLYLITASAEIGKYMNLHSGKEAVDIPKANEVLLSAGIADIMNIHVGDTVEMRNPDMEVLKLTVSAIYDNHVYNYAIITPETMEAQWNRTPGLQMAFVTLRDGLDPYTAGAAATGADGVMNVTVSDQLADTVGHMMKALDLVVMVVVFCAGLLAVIVLYNLTNINITERIREIATIKVLGFNAFETAMYVFKENLVLSIMGTIFGIPLGKLLLDFVISQIKIDMIWLKARLEWPSLLLSVVLTVLSAVIVDCIFYFKLDKINMAEALKSVE